MTSSKTEREATRKARSQDGFAAQTDVTIALAAGGLSLALTHDQQASADVRNANAAPSVIDQDTLHAVDVTGQHSAQVMSESTASLAATGLSGTEQAFAIEQSSAAANTAGLSAPEDTVGQSSSANDSSIVDDARVERVVHANPAATADQPAGLSGIGQVQAESLLQAPDSLLDRAIDMTSTAMQAVGSVASAAASAVTQVFDAVENLLGSQVQTIEHVTNASLDLVGQATQSVHGFDTLVGSHTVDDVSGVAPALLGAVTPALDESPAMGAVGELGGWSELVPVQLGFLGQSYADPYEPAGLLHGFV